MKDIGRKQIGFKVIVFINSILFNSLLNVYLLLLAFSRMGVHVYKCMCRHMYVRMHVDTRGQPQMLFLSAV